MSRFLMKTANKKHSSKIKEIVALLNNLQTEEATVILEAVQHYLTTSTRVVKEDVELFIEQLYKEED